MGLRLSESDEGDLVGNIRGLIADALHGGVCVVSE